MSHNPDVGKTTAICQVAHMADELIINVIRETVTAIREGKPLKPS